MTELTKDEASLAHNGLIFWRNWMQTRNVLLSANDAIEQESPEMIQPLNSFQKMRVGEIEALIDKLERLYRGEV